MATLTNDRLLFTPGPATTSTTVKQAMMRDLGVRDDEFVALVREVRRKLLGFAGVTREDGYEAVLVPGSGTYAIESVLSSTAPIDGKVLVAVNGTHGRRMLDITRRHVIEASVLTFPEHEPVSVERIEKELIQDRWIRQVAVVHCETTTGILNPVPEISDLCRRRRKQLIVDSMGSFGGIPYNLQKHPADFLASTASQCLEGVPGLSFALCNRQSLEATAGLSRTVSLDLLAQWQAMEDTGQFRFTPPTHTLLALIQALRELEGEGGVEARYRRYATNQKTLVKGMREMGFQEYVAPQHQSPIITTFLVPPHPRFELHDFDRRLREKGFVIHPVKLTHEDCFQVGSTGRLGKDEVLGLLQAMQTVLEEMEVDPRAVDPLE